MKYSNELQWEHINVGHHESIPINCRKSGMAYQRPITGPLWHEAWRMFQFKTHPRLLGPWHLTSIENPIVKIRRSYDRLISAMGFPILVRWHLYIKPGPCRLSDITSYHIRQHRHEQTQTVQASHKTGLQINIGIQINNMALPYVWVPVAWKECDWLQYLRCCLQVLI